MKIFIPKRNVWTPQPRWGIRKYQKGIICATAVYSSVEAPVLNLDGHIANAVNVNATARGTIVIRADGTMDKIINTTTSQIDSTADWIRPEDAAPDDYEARYTGLTGDPLDATTTAAVNVWHALDLADYFFEQIANVGTNDDFVSNFTIEIRKGSSGGALVSGAYTCDAQNITI